MATRRGRHQATHYVVFHVVSRYNIYLKRRLEYEKYWLLATFLSPPFSRNESTIMHLGNLLGVTYTQTEKMGSFFRDF